MILRYSQNGWIIEGLNMDYSYMKDLVDTYTDT